MSNDVQGFAEDVVGLKGENEDQRNEQRRNGDRSKAGKQCLLQTTVVPAGE